VNAQIPTKPDPAEALCLACGLCCNGAIFNNVKLQATDNAEQLRRLDLPLKRFGVKLGCHQPCPAFVNERCRIYAWRPTHCRTFECMVLKRLKAGALKSGAAFKRVALARRRVATVTRLLSALGNRDDTTSLQARFRKTMATSHELNPDHVADLSKLTLAMHRLNLLLSHEFYPSP
jgi:uncharacterized protein